ncbi:hypothetical protein [Paraburkholderia atlantica]|uniref:hypothetical protein n=1 Tax=Paraburkholderia atlantica TaxID=2654982 RepID=UPI0016171C13|nr:hypothetical protein [Paraburkholderia atlantica]MBB5508108.1 uncharacterized protein YfaQ (DUF2300 family) [Paraburkholderia atlantica]
MSITIEHHEGAVTYLSDAGKAAYTVDAARHEEQRRLARVDRLYTEIKIGAAGGALLTIAGLIAKQLLGA